MKTMNKTVSTVTSFKTWVELIAALENGYVPTMKGRTRRERILEKMIRACGYRVWNG